MDSGCHGSSHFEVQQRAEGAGPSLPWLQQPVVACLVGIQIPGELTALKSVSEKLQGRMAQWLGFLIPLLWDWCFGNFLEGQCA